MHVTLTALHHSRWVCLCVLQKGFKPALPGDVVVSFYVQAQKLVLAVYHLCVNASHKVDIASRYQVMSSFFAPASHEFSFESSWGVFLTNLLWLSVSVKSYLALEHGTISQYTSGGCVRHKVWYVFQLECSVPWLNEVLVLCTLALQQCQQLRHKVTTLTEIGHMAALTSLKLVCWEDM